MPTYRRFTCVERSITFFLEQKTDIDRELIIFNTDIDFPLELDDTFTPEEKSLIKIFNNSIDYKEGVPYTNTGAIRRDAFTYATGELYITWDDDDIFFPWNIQQCYDGLVRTGKRAWKPEQSFGWTGETKPAIGGNVLEATIMLYSSEVHFKMHCGGESLDWYERLSRNNQLIADPYSIPAYCFYWKDDPLIGGHKQSAFFGESDNYEQHLKNTRDVATRKLTRKKLSDYKDILSHFDESFRELALVKKDLVEKYIPENYYD